MEQQEGLLGSRCSAADKAGTPAVGKNEAQGLAAGHTEAVRSSVQKHPGGGPQPAGGGGGHTDLAGSTDRTWWADLPEAIRAR